jgi:energy-coupling factor transport system permease protein
MIGQYFPGDSFLHRMDARVKILLLLILLIEVFVFTSAPVYLLMTGITFLLIMTSKVPLRMVLRSLKPLWWIILFTFVLHLFSHPGGKFTVSGSLSSRRKVWNRGP